MLTPSRRNCGDGGRATLSDDVAACRAINFPRPFDLRQPSFKAPFDFADHGIALEVGDDPIQMAEIEDLDPELKLGKV